MKTVGELGGGVEPGLGNRVWGRVGEGGGEQEVKREDPEEGGEEGQENCARKVEGALCRPLFQEQLLGAVGWGWGGSSGQFCRS